MAMKLNLKKRTNLQLLQSTKEVCITSGLPYNILRHKECLHFSLVKSKIPICKKCAIFTRSKKYKSKKSNNKGNERIECSPQQIMEKIKVLVPNLENNQLTLIESHITASCVNKNRMRWDKDIICMALSLFNRNPAAYRDLTVNNWLHLPSKSVLGRYKNAIIQKPGVINDMMYWMHNEAKSQKLTIEGYYGGIILDEMAIQEDLQIVHTKNDTKLVGLSDSGVDVKHMNVLNTGKQECELANHVLQYVFSGLTGFRWPFANFPNTRAPPVELFITFWNCVDALYKWGFKPL